ncbi:GAF domain-containing protein [Pseudorhodoferax sp. Leaf267]|uniref:GAF domain-containing protein n=1 Tax=Pseudorhodoferax sp. Leaf267 TaxID=1736316 RepID=UPI0006F21AE6|nr:GAF domain-containing protein [Pseudorhodoferax sp. Leaf267]KQP22034.1 hypothetical protein ASF43_24655 [Pseudorhodoferax sp. Leaf267]
MSRTTFIRVVEYWLPSADGSLLEYGGGVFGSATRFEAATEHLCFGRGEGLPGQAWDLGHPIVLKDLTNSYFRRGPAAQAAGLTCGIALPIFDGSTLRAVVVLFCGDDEAHAGAIELWANDADAPADLKLVDGYYGTTGDTFEFISRATAFRKGTGLPGRVWESESPVFLPDLGKGSGFLRAEGAIKVGINRGFAIPCTTPEGQVFVITFLSALATPIASSVGIWEAGHAGEPPRRSFGFSEAEGVLEGVAPAGQAGVVASVLASGQPVVDGAAITIPVAPGGQMRAAMVLGFH